MKSPPLLVGKQNSTATLEDSSADAYEVKQILPYSLVITLFGIYPFEMKIYVYTKNCIQMLIAALFITTPSQKPLRDFSKGE